MDYYFPEKSIKISTLDKKWMNPGLKSLHRKVQREFYKHRQSKKWKKLKHRFKKLKRKSIKSFYNNFITELKNTEPGNWYKMAKRIGAVDVLNSGEISVEQLDDLNEQESAEAIASHFASISNQYSPLNTHDLPCYLPALQPPQVDEYSVYKRMKKLKNTRSTFPLDIPNKLRKEFSVELAAPMTDIINTSLLQQRYPGLWKHELVTPALKVSHPKTIKDLRKISSTSDFSKLFEGFIKEWVMEDISESLDIGQFGGQSGTGTEHMLVCMVDRILRLLESVPSAVVIAAMVDWSAAFDRQDPTLAIKKFIKLGVRPSLIPLLVSYLSERKMKVKFNGATSTQHNLIGGGPQGTLLGLIEYIVQSNDAANCVDEEDRYRYIDDLSILEILSLAGLLVEYDYLSHVPSDIGTDQLFLPPESCATQSNLDSIAAWTKKNLMKINEDKTNYMLFTRTDADFATRLTMNGAKIDMLEECKIVGVVLTSDLKWDRNTKELTRRAYSRMSMITKLKYVGVKHEDLLDVYKLFIRSLLEYCAVVWHSRLTSDLRESLERVQKSCLRVILGDQYTNYAEALEICKLKTLFERREDRCLSFAKKCLKHPIHSRLFPTNGINMHDTRDRERFSVNFAKTDAYRNSAIPYMQRMLNVKY